MDLTLRLTLILALFASGLGYATGSGFMGTRTEALADDSSGTSFTIPLDGDDREEILGDETKVEQRAGDTKISKTNPQSQKENDINARALLAKSTVSQPDSSVSKKETTKASQKLSTAQSTTTVRESVRSPRECDFEGVIISALSTVRINEIAWMGGLNSAADEWIELWNSGSGATDISGWQVRNKKGTIGIAFPENTLLMPSSYAVLERGDETTVGSVRALATYKGALGNSDDGLRFFNSNCELIDEAIAVPRWPAGEAETRKTMERDQDGDGWHTSLAQAGTPGGQNSTQPPPPGSFLLSILSGGSGAGTIVSTPQGINCGYDCDEEFDEGTQVTLRAVPAGNSEIEHWEGACGGSESLCVFTMSQAKVAQIIFTNIGVVANNPPPPSPNPQSASSTNPTPSGEVGRVVISEIQITGGSGATDHDFVEFYNPTSVQFNLKGHRLVKRTAQGIIDTSIKSWTTDTYVPSHGFYLWANTNAGVQADAVTTGTIADNNSIAIRQGLVDTGTVIDAVSWGDAQNGLGEGARLAGGLTANQSFERKAFHDGACTSALNSGETWGNGCDTNDNNADFEIRALPHPQNSQSPAE